MKKKSLVCGIGNPMLKDDRAGIEVAERIEQSPLSVDTVVIYGVGFEVIDKLIGYDDVVIIDAAMIGAPPGTITEVCIDQIFTDHNLATSHAVTLGSTLKIGYDLFPEEMPEKMRIFLIEAEDYFEFTKECSAKVSEAIDRVVAMIMEHFSTDKPSPLIERGVYENIF